MLCLINERRSGPPRRPGEDNILLFCYESSSERNRRNSLKWRRARLNNLAFTINSGPTSSRHLPGPQGLQAHHGNVDNSQYNAFLALWQHERLCEHGYVWVCNLVCWIIKPLKCCFIGEWEHVIFLCVQAKGIFKDIGNYWENSYLVLVHLTEKCILTRLLFTHRIETSVHFHTLNSQSKSHVAVLHILGPCCLYWLYFKWKPCDF